MTLALAGRDHLRAKAEERRKWEVLPVTSTGKMDVSRRELLNRVRRAQRAGPLTHATLAGKPDDDPDAITAAGVKSRIIGMVDGDLLHLTHTGESSAAGAFLDEREAQFAAEQRAARAALERKMAALLSTAARAPPLRLTDMPGRPRPAALMDGPPAAAATTTAAAVKRLQLADAPSSKSSDSPPPRGGGARGGAGGGGGGGTTGKSGKEGERPVGYVGEVMDGVIDFKAAVGDGKARAEGEEELVGDVDTSQLAKSVRRMALKDFGGGRPIDELLRHARVARYGGTGEQSPRAAAARSGSAAHVAAARGEEEAEGDGKLLTAGELARLAVLAVDMTGEDGGEAGDSRPPTSGGSPGSSRPATRTGTAGAQLAALASRRGDRMLAPGAAGVPDGTLAAREAADRALVPLPSRGGPTAADGVLSTLGGGGGGGGGVASPTSAYEAALRGTRMRVQALVNATATVNAQANMMQHGALLRPLMEGMNRVMLNAMAADGTASSIVAAGAEREAKDVAVREHIAALRTARKEEKRRAIDAGAAPVVPPELAEVEAAIAAAAAATTHADDGSDGGGGYVYEPDAPSAARLTDRGSVAPSLGTFGDDFLHDYAATSTTPPLERRKRAAEAAAAATARGGGSDGGDLTATTGTRTRAPPAHPEEAARDRFWGTYTTRVLARDPTGRDPNRYVPERHLRQLGDDGRWRSGEAHMAYVEGKLLPDDPHTTLVLGFDASAPDGLEATSVEEIPYTGPLRTPAAPAPEPPAAAPRIAPGASGSLRAALDAVGGARSKLFPPAGTGGGGGGARRGVAPVARGGAGGGGAATSRPLSGRSTLPPVSGAGGTRSPPSRPGTTTTPRSGTPASHSTTGGARRV